MKPGAQLVAELRVRFGDDRTAIRRVLLEAIDELDRHDPATATIVVACDTDDEPTHTGVSVPRGRK